MTITNIRIMIAGGDGYMNVTRVESLDSGALSFVDDRGLKHLLGPSVPYHVIDSMGLPDKPTKPITPAVNWR